ncbi:MAG: hypothetical protein WCF95_03330 [bacterium]
MGGPVGKLVGGCSETGCSAFGGPGKDLSPVHFVDIQVGGPLKRQDMICLNLGGPSEFQREQERIAETKEHAGKQAELAKQQALKDAKLNKAVEENEAGDFEKAAKIMFPGLSDEEYTKLSNEAAKRINTYVSKDRVARNVEKLAQMNHQEQKWELMLRKLVNEGLKIDYNAMGLERGQ